MSDVKQPWTAGKWDIGNENNEYCEVCIDHDAGQTVISLGRHDSLPTGKEFIISREEMLAVAHLVKQAPEMAEALAKFVRIFERNTSAGARGQMVMADPPEISAARVILDAIGWRREGGR